LLTLLGPGGSGKTRLGIEAASRVDKNYQDGVFFVNLAPIQEIDKIPSTIAGVLHLSFSEGGTPKEQLLDYLRNKDMLLVLDNFEHLLAGVDLVNQILRTAQKVSVLSTSRTRLAVTGEHLYEVSGMAYPEVPASLKNVSNRYSAVRLFESEASRVLGNFKLTEGNLPEVIQICSLLEGMPLGIVLAANWVRMLSLDEIAEEIARDLAFLDTTLRDLPQRQRSLRSVFNHSWRLLNESEREIMAALSVFRGGFSREAAQKVAGASLIDLMELLDKSILHQTSKGRYEVHELLRQYAAEKLGIDPYIEEGIRGKHSNYYCQGLVGRERDLQGPRQGAALKEMVSDIDNIRIAWAWAVENTRWQQLFGSLNGLCFFYYRSRQRMEGIATCQALVEKLIEVRDSDKYKLEDRTTQIDILKLQARALAWGVFFNGITGNVDLARTLSQQCLALLETANLASQDTRLEKGIVLHSPSWSMQEVFLEQHMQLAEEAVGLFRSLGESWWVAQTLSTMRILSKSIVAVQKVLEDSLDIRKRLGDLRGIADSLRFLALSFASLRQFKKAETYIYEALAIAQELSDRLLIVLVRSNLNGVLIWQGRFEEARSLNCETLKTYGDLVYTQSKAALIHADAAFPDQYLGEYDAACEQAQNALELLKDVKHYWAGYVTAFAIDILGRVALAEGAYGDAEKRFQECYPVYQAYDNPGNIGQAHACLGYTARGLNRLSPSQGHFYEALKLAIEFEDFLSLTHIIPGIALLFAD